METRLANPHRLAPEAYNGLAAVSAQLKASTLGKALIALVDLRASQINGCAFCLDMHIKEAIIHGERPLRLHHVATWRESQLFAPRERAALAWTEAVTQLSPLGVPDDIYERVRTQFSEEVLVDLAYEEMAINAWSRINVAFRVEPGTADKAFGLDKAGLS